MRKPNFCPKCGSRDIGRLDRVGSSWAGEIETDKEYEKLGGRWYCLGCGWGEDIPREYLVTCFLCGERFEGYTDETEFCPKCGFIICPKCEGCKCSLTPEEALIVDRMFETEKTFLSWWLKQRGLQLPEVEGGAET